MEREAMSSVILPSSSVPLTRTPSGGKRHSNAGRSPHGLLPWAVGDGGWPYPVLRSSADCSSGRNSGFHADQEARIRDGPEVLARRQGVAGVLQLLRPHFCVFFAGPTHGSADHDDADTAEAEKLSGGNRRGQLSRGCRRRWQEISGLFVGVESASAGGGGRWSGRHHDQHTGGRGKGHHACSRRARARPRGQQWGDCVQAFVPALQVSLGCGWRFGPRSEF